MSQGMSVADAAYLTVHDYKGGAAALQVRLGKTNLSAEVNPNSPGAKLGLVDAVRIQAMAADYRIMYAMAAELRHYPPVPMLPGDYGEGAPGLKTLAELLKECSDVVSTVSMDMADGDVSDNDLARAQREGGELVAKVQQLLGELAALNAAKKARGLA